jgi:Zn-dependent membrane protease YugP
MNRRILLMAGLIPLPWFLIWSSLAGALATDYHALSQHASELTLRPGAPHTLLNVAAIGSGVAFIAFAIGLWLESGKRLAIGALCWLAFGIAMTSNGL